MANKSNDNVPLSYRIFGTRTSAWPPDVAEREADAARASLQTEKAKETFDKLKGLRDGPERHAAVQDFLKLARQEREGNATPPDQRPTQRRKPKR